MQIAETNTSKGTAFAQSLYTAPQSNTVMWASFIINLSTLPGTPSGTYLAHFEDTNFGFYGRIIALTSNNPAYTPDLCQSCGLTLALTASASLMTELLRAPSWNWTWRPALTTTWLSIMTW